MATALRRAKATTTIATGHEVAKGKRYDGTGAARNFLDDIGPVWTRARPALTLTLTYVSAGATRIRAVGACPSRLFPSVPRLTSSLFLVFCFLPRAASASVPLWPAITRTSAPLTLLIRSPLRFGRSIVQTRRRKRRHYLYSCAPGPPEKDMQDRRRENRRRRRGGRRRDRASPRCVHTKLYRGESNLPAASIDDLTSRRRRTLHH